MQILQENALFSCKIYTVGTISTRPPVATVATNFKSGYFQPPFPTKMYVSFQLLLCTIMHLGWVKVSVGKFGQKGNSRRNKNRGNRNFLETKIGRIRNSWWFITSLSPVHFLVSVHLHLSWWYCIGLTQNSIRKLYVWTILLRILAK